MQFQIGLDQNLISLHSGMHLQNIHTGEFLIFLSSSWVKLLTIYDSQSFLIPKKYTACLTSILCLFSCPRAEKLLEIRSKTKSFCHYIGITECVGHHASMISSIFFIKWQ